jgi:hypothetical protein
MELFILIFLIIYLSEIFENKDDDNIDELEYEEGMKELKHLNK